MRESAALAHMPAGVTFEEAAAVCDGAIIALTCLRAAGPARGAEHPGLRRIGLDRHRGGAARQALGAHVTAVCNTKNLELMRSLGADEVVDYLQEDFTKNGETYDVVFDAVGKHSFRRSRRSLKPGGAFIETDLGFMWHVPPLALLTRWIGDKRVTLPIPKYTKEDVLFLKRAHRGREVPRGDRPDAIRSRTWSRRRGTSRRGRRPATSS